MRADRARHEITPFAGDGFLGWSQDSRRRPFHQNLYVRRPDGSRVQVNAPGTQGFGGGIDALEVVYTEYGRRGSDVKLFDLATGTRRSLPAITTGRAEMRPTISGDWILFDRQGARSSEVVLYNRASGARRRLMSADPSRAAVYAGQVNGGYAVFGRVGTVRGDVFRHDIATAVTTRIARPGSVGRQFDPGVTADGTVYFGRHRSVCDRVRLMRWRPGGAAGVVARLPRGHTLGYPYASVAGDATEVHFGRGPCNDGPWDIFKVVEGG